MTLPKKPTEITKEEYDALYKKFEDHAGRLVEVYKNLGWKKVGYGHFFSGAKLPCYLSLFGRLSYSDPKTGEKEKTQQVPVDYNIEEKDKVLDLFHFSPAGCHALKPFYSVVPCLCETEEKGKPHYYTHRHRVGECPFKER